MDDRLLPVRALAVRRLTEIFPPTRTSKVLTLPPKILKSLDLS